MLQTEKQIWCHRKSI